MAPTLELNDSLGGATVTGDTSRFKVVTNGGRKDDAGSADGDERQERPKSASGAVLERRNSVPPRQPDREQGGSEGVHRRPAIPPTLQRFKSEYGPCPAESAERKKEPVPDWGARHGFEDHYQSEHIISQLANVSCLVAISNRRRTRTLRHLHWSGCALVMMEPDRA